MTARLDALRSSVERLAALVRPLGADVRRHAYPTEWTIADVLSHLGSGAVIMTRNVDDAVAGQSAPDGFNQSVWDEWNAKSPEDQASDSLSVDAVCVERLEALTPEQRGSIQVALGPMQLGFDQIVGMRLNEHLLHEWDIAVALDPSATLAADGTEQVVDNLELIGRFAAKPAGSPRTVTVATTAPSRTFTVTVDAAAASLSAGAEGTPDITLPAEAFIRLVYGRLDPDHTPSDVQGDRSALDGLRAVFPGI
ncbi:MAG TPA: maleylpyruvate isomerase family mycothiol-dependent enzyme [Acidimicrobiia bacterium]|jgi:uncharacterized protein (TIGR03083 family)